MKECARCRRAWPLRVPSGRGEPSRMGRRTSSVCPVRRSFRTAPGTAWSLAGSSACCAPSTPRPSTGLARRSRTTPTCSRSSRTASFTIPTDDTLPAHAPAAAIEREAAPSPVLARYRRPRQPGRRGARRPGGRRPPARVGGGDPLSPGRRARAWSRCSTTTRARCRASTSASSSSSSLRIAPVEVREVEKLEGETLSPRGDATPLPEHGVVVAARVRRSRRRGPDPGREEPARSSISTPAP